MCIETTPVSTHDLDLGVLLKPFRSRLGGALPQYVYDLSPLQVDNNRSVAPALLPTSIIDASDPQCRTFPNGRAPLYEPQDCVITLRDAKTMQQSFGWTPSGHMTKQAGQFTGPTSPPGVRERTLFQPLHEALSSAPIIPTAPSGYVDLEPDGETLNGQILQAANISER